MTFRSRFLGAIAAAVLLLAPHRSHAATFTIINQDAAGEGLNDTTPRVPVGGNTGTTLGEQRLIAAQQAAATWGAVIGSNVDIVVAANFDALNCNVNNSNTATLGSAGATHVVRDFIGAPQSSTWYPSALANALAGSDLDPSSNDISMRISSNLDSGCLPGISGFYYGLDGNEPAGTIDLQPVLRHELAHGLGFSTLVNLTTGAKASGFDDIYMRNLEDHSSGKLWPNMTNLERIASALDNGDLHFVGANVVASSAFLTAGRHASGHVQIYAPTTLANGSSVSHFDTALLPNELMEPFIVNNALGTLVTQAMYDLGWPPPGPTSTATLSPTPTITPTATITATISPTPTQTATRTPTLSATLTATQTPTRTASATPTQTATRTPTVTETATETATATPSFTPSPTPTATATAVVASLVVAAGQPGGYACVSAELVGGGQPVAAALTSISDASGDFSPVSCTINPAIGANSPLAKSIAQSSMLGIESVDIGGNSALIPDGWLYACAVFVPANTAPGTYPLGYSLQALDGTAAPLPSSTSNAALTVATCVGDCDGNGMVSIGELSRAITQFLGGPFPCSAANPGESCPMADGNLNGVVSLSEVSRTTTNLLNGCPP